MLFPHFWLKPKFKYSILPYLLYPITFLWIGCTKLKQIIEVPTKHQIPIICVGNITIGGNGKTPTTIKIRSLLQELGYKPHILSRGYKSRLKGPHLVNPKTNSFLDVGDEALMMSLYGPTWIARNRRSGVKSAIKAGADVIVLDDGFQNNSIKKDLSILVIETSIGFGNGFLIPAGPLRERVSSGLAKADIVITIGDQLSQVNFEKTHLFIKKNTIVRGRLVPKINTPHLKEKAVFAFAGIAHPKKFKATLETLEAKIIKFTEFSNHKPFKEKTLEKLIADAEEKHAIVVTTEKDLMRIPKNLRQKIHALKVSLELEDQNFLVKKIRKIISSN